MWSSRTDEATFGWGVYMMILMVLVVVSIFWMAIDEARSHPGIRSHKVTVHHAAWLQPIVHQIGKTTVVTYIPHPAYDTVEDVCDERKK